MFRNESFSRWVFLIGLFPLSIIWFMCESTAAQLRKADQLKRGGPSDETLGFVLGVIDHDI